MSLPDFGEEQLTQPHWDLSEPREYCLAHILELIHELSRAVGAICPATNHGPLTLYLGGGAAAVLSGAREHSKNGLCLFAATPRETNLISRIAVSLEPESDLRLQLTDRTLQDLMAASPQVVQRLVQDAASIEPIHSTPDLQIIIPRWEIPYAIKMHELAFDNDGRALRWVPLFLVCYLLATTTGPREGHVLESAVQEHVRSLFPHADTSRRVPRSIFDKVNRRCRKRLGIEPILFEG